MKFNDNGIDLSLKQQKYLDYKSTPEFKNRERASKKNPNYIDVEDFNGYPYKMAPMDIGLPLASEKMILMQMSFNNKVFLFYHRDLDKMLLYGINLNKRPEVEIDDALVQSLTAKFRKVRPAFEFEYIYEIDFE